MTRALNSNLEDKLKEMIKILMQTSNKYENNGLMGGKAGISLFIFYYSKYLDSDYYHNIGYDLIFNVLSNINEGNIYHSFSSGVAGDVWLMNHFVSTKFIESNTEEMFNDFDDFLFSIMEKNLLNSNYDFLHGALGMVLCVLKKVINIKNDSYLYKAIYLLEQESLTEQSNFTKWLSIIDYKTNKKAYNISMSHGIASIIAILSKIYKRGINKEKTKHLLEGAMNYLLQQKLPKGKFISIFPNLALESMERLFSSRLAWCYGDLGISVAIWHASQALGRKDWEEEAINILLHSAKRRDLKENGVVDAGLCHGTAGIAHIFNRMYVYTGLEELKETSNYWFDQTLRMARFEDGLAGYKAWQGTERGWVNEPGLLEGIAGIGLAMISAVSDIDPAWDECLLLS